MIGFLQAQINFLQTQLKAYQDKITSGKEEISKDAMVVQDRLNRGEIVEFDNDCTLSLVSQEKVNQAKPNSMLGTYSLMLNQVGQQVFTSVRASGYYELVFTNANVAKMFNTGQYTLTKLKGTNLATTSLGNGKGYVGSAGLRKVNLMSMGAAVFGAVSFIVGQYHLIGISTKLESIEQAVDKILTSIEREKIVKLEVCIDDAVDLLYDINIEASCPTDDLQKIDVDNRLSALCTRAKEVQKSLDLEIHDFKVKFEHKIKANEPIPQEDIQEAEKVFTRLVKSVRLSFMIAKLKYNRDTIRKYDETSINRSATKIEEAMKRVDELAETFKMFYLPLNQNNTFWHKIKCYFPWLKQSDKDKEKESILDAWRTETLKSFQSQGEKFNILLYYDSERKDLEFKSITEA